MKFRLKTASVVTLTVIISVFTFNHRYQPVISSAQAQAPTPTRFIPPEACGATCTNDSDCLAVGTFCHKTIEWGTWQGGSVSSLPGSGNITGWNTHVKVDGSVVKEVVRGGKVHTYFNNQWDNGDDFSDCEGTGPGTCGQNPIPIGIGADGIPNPVVGYNTVVTTSADGVKFLRTHLVRTDGIYEKLQEYETGAIVDIWSKSSALNNLKAEYGTPGNWQWLGFDSGVKYQDGRQQQRLIIAKVDNNTGRYIETKVLSRIQVNNGSWGPWRIAAISTPGLSEYGLGGSGAQGMIMSYDSAFNAVQNKYIDSLIRWYWNGSSYVAQYWERTANANNTLPSQCRPEVYPESCQLPAYIPPVPTNTLAPEPSNTPIPSATPPGTLTWTTPTNLTATAQCTNKKVAATWTMPNQEAARDYSIATRSCKRNAPNQTDCTNPVVHNYTKSQTTYNTTNQTVSLIRDFNHFVPQGQTYEAGITYLMAVRVGTTGNSSMSDYSNYVAVRFAGPEGDQDGNCAVNQADYTSIVTQFFDEIDHVLTDNWALFLLNKLVRNFGTSS